MNSEQQRLAIAEAWVGVSSVKKWLLKINNLEDRRVIIAHYLNNDMIDEKCQMKYEDIKIQTIYDVDECYLGITGILKTKLK